MTDRTRRHKEEADLIVSKVNRMRLFRSLALSAVVAITLAACGGGTLDLGGACASTSLATISPTSPIVADGRAQATVTVRANNCQGFPVAGLNVVISAPGAGVTTRQPPATDASGLAIGSIASTVAGVKDVSIFIDGVALPQALHVTFIPAPETQLAFTVQPTGTQAGAAITPSIQVSVEDAAGNIVTTATDAITLTLASGSAALTNTTANAVAGVATFTGFSVLQAGTGYQLTASASGLSSAVSAPFAITSGIASQLVFIVQPSNTQTHTVISPAIEVGVEDNLGDLVRGATGAVTLAIGTRGSAGILMGTVTQPIVNGIATFDDLAITGAGNGYTLVATASGAGATLAGAESHAFNVAAGPPSRTASTIVTCIDPVVADGVSMCTITVTVVDGDGALLVGAPVDFSADGLGNLFSATQGVTGAGGTFTVTLASTHAGTKTITATVGAGAGAFNLVASAAFIAGSACAAGSAIGATPSQGIAADGVQGANVTVTVVDCQGNPVANEAVALSADGSSNAFTKVGGVPSSSATGQTGIDGTFTASLSSLTAEKKTVTATVGASNNVSLTTFVTFVAPQPTQLAFLVQPSSSQAGARIAPAVKVEATDNFGVLVPTASGSIMLSIVTSGGSGTLSGTMTKDLIGGIATFDDLAISGAGKGYVLFASYPLRESPFAESFPFDVDSASTDGGAVAATDGGSLPGIACASDTVLTVSPPQAPADGTTAIALLLFAKDCNGHAAAGVLVSLSATGAGDLLSLPTAASGSSLTVAGVTGADGSFSGWLSTSIAETKVISATVGSTPSAFSLSADVTFFAPVDGGSAGGGDAGPP